MAELVIAEAPYKQYPGGIIAIRAVDYMASARGTLTSGTDSLACTGTYVRDSQKVSTNMRTSWSAAFQSADDTLVISKGDLPVSDDNYYAMYLSVRVEGDWDVTNIDTMYGCTNNHFASQGGGVYPVCVGWYGGHILESAPYAIGHLPRHRPHYLTLGFAFFGGQTIQTPGDYDISVKALSQVGTDLAVYIDQIILLPTGKNSWDSFRANAVNWVYADPFNQLEIIDGADGGDEWGEFTWAPDASFSNAHDPWPYAGDYQRKSSYSSAEYYRRLYLDEDGGDWVLGDGSAPFQGGPKDVPAFAYGCYCALYRPAETIMDEEFDDRTITPVVGGLWGRTSEGFGWRADSSGGDAYKLEGVQGGYGIWEWPSGFVTDGFNSFQQHGSNPSSPTVGAGGAGLEISEHGNFSGKWTWWDEFLDWWRFSFFDSGMELYINIGNFRLDWHFGEPDIYAFALTYGGTILYSVPWTPPAYDGLQGWRLEIRRYAVRFRMWDGGGAEPSTWDYEGFIPYSPPSSSEVLYPYTTELQRVKAGEQQWTLSTNLVVAEVFTHMKFAFDSFKVEYDPGGSPADMHAAIERPDGTKIDEITIPYGAAYFVYWDKMDWTDFDTDIYPYPVLAYSTRLWNDPGAAELQRAGQLFDYFFVPLFFPKYASIFWHPYKKELTARRYGG